MSPLQAFSSSEVNSAKNRVNQLQEFQTQLDEYCRSMRWIMDVVAYARDRTVTAGVPLADVQYSLCCLDRHSLEEEGDERLMHIPAIFLSAPSEHTPTINVQSECNSTPSSPPPALTCPLGSVVLGRRKSRDDSYLEEHHRQQNPFHSLAQQRFHHQYRLGDESVDCWQPQLKPTDPLADLDPCPAINGSHSAYSLLDSVRVASNSADHRQSLSAERGAIEDMRRCVSASKLMPEKSTSALYSPLYFDLRSPSPVHSDTQADTDTEAKSPSHSATFFFGSDVDVSEGHSQGTLGEGQCEEFAGAERCRVEAGMDTSIYRPLSRLTLNLPEDKIEEMEEDGEGEEARTQGHSSHGCPPVTGAWSDLPRDPQSEGAFADDFVPSPFCDRDPGQTESRHQADPSSASPPYFEVNFDSLLSEPPLPQSDLPISVNGPPEEPPVRIEGFQVRKRFPRKNPACRVRRMASGRGKCCHECCCGSGSKGEPLSSSSSSDDLPGVEGEECSESEPGRSLTADSAESLLSGPVSSGRGHTVSVYLAYQCSVPLGTEVSLRVTPACTVADVTSLVVPYFNSVITRRDPLTRKAFWRRASPREVASQHRVYSHSQLASFSLLAVYGANVKHLNRDFHILSLQPPWNEAKLCLKYNGPNHT